MNPVIALIITSIIGGLGAPIYKLALTNIPPFTLGFIRFFFAGSILFPIMIIKWKKMDIKSFYEIFIGAFLGLTVATSFYYLGLMKTQAINAPIIGSAGPIFLFFLSIIFLKEKAKLKVMFGMILALLGALVVIFSPIFFEGKELALGEIQGNLFFVIAMIAVVARVLIHKKALEKVNFYQVSTISFFLAALTFFPFMMRELDSWSFRQLNINGLAGIVFGVFISSCIGYLLYNYGISKIKAQEVGLFTYIDPVVAVIIAMPLLGEYPNLYFIIGSVFVFLGIYVAEGRLHYHPIHKIKEHKKHSIWEKITHKN